MLRRLKENKKKGFTLVELIVVLVILAILAALLVPALTGYIDRAKRKSIVAETRQCVMAAQTIADEAYGTVEVGATVTVDVDKVKELAEVKGTVSGITLANAANTATPNKVTGLTYSNNTYTCTYAPGVASNTDGDYNVSKAGSTNADTEGQD